MQIRFRLWDETKKSFNLISYVDIKDYDVAFKMFTYMKEHKSEFCIEVNTEDIVDTIGEDYSVVDVSFCVPALGNDITPHIVVDLEEW